MLNISCTPNGGSTVKTHILYGKAETLDIYRFYKSITKKGLCHIFWQFDFGMCFG